MVGPIAIERFGRFVRLRNTASPEEFALATERAKELSKEVLVNLEGSVKDLQEQIARFSALDIMNRAAYVLLPLLAQFRAEHEYSGDEARVLPATEYLQYLIARTPRAQACEHLSEESWDRLWSLTLRVFDQTLEYLMLRQPQGTVARETEELRFLIDSRRLAVRVKRWPLFLGPHLRSALKPYAPQLQAAFALTVDALVDGIARIAEHQKRAVGIRYSEYYDATVSLMKALDEAGFNIAPDATQEEQAEVTRALEREPFKTQRAEVEQKARAALTPELFDITDVSSLPREVLAVLSVRPAESVLTKLTGPNHDDLSPLSPSVLHLKPFLEVDERVYSFYHSGLEDHIDRLMEAELLSRFPEEESSMLARRGVAIEDEVNALLQQALAADWVLAGITYPDPDNVGAMAELDLLVAVDDMLLIVEVKAGAISSAGARGAPKSIESDLQDLILEGQRQSERAHRYLLSADEVPVFDLGGKVEIRRIRMSEFRQVIRVVVTREDLGWVGARIAVLSVLDPSLTRSKPWHVSLDDLRAICDLFEGDEISFAHYLESRLLAAAEEWLVQHDEMEHVALYLAMNYYHEPIADDTHRMSFGSEYTKEIDHYFMGKSAGESPEKPRQSLPSDLRHLLQALRESRQKHRLAAGTFLLALSGEYRRKLSLQLRELRARMQVGREPSLRLPVSAANAGLTVSYCTVATWQEELRRSAVQMRRARCQKWICVRLERTAEYIVDNITLLTSESFSETELAEAMERDERLVAARVRAEAPGRNDTCPCGSGKKFKRCHGR